MTEIRTLFSGDYIDRCADLRRNADALDAARRDPATRFLPVWQARCLSEGAAAARLTRAALGARLADDTPAILLGREAAGYLFAVPLEGREEPAELGQFVGLRELITRMPEREAALLAYARAMINWHRQHRYCGVCGAANELQAGGFVLQCPASSCSHRSFPRLDPAIIVLVYRGERCLLGRQPSWPENRFSTIAGFVEPGESLEDAVRREVAEETDIRIGRCHYLASQPWPFPSALMIGFHAEAESEIIRLNDAELAEARWLSRGEIAAAAVILPPRASVAFRLIEAWFDTAPGPGLAELHRDGAFLRRSDGRPEGH